MVPVYGEQLVVVKRLVMKERIRIRRIATTERRLFEDTLRRERLVIEDSGQPDMHRQFVTAAAGRFDCRTAPKSRQSVKGASFTKK